ncbi:FAD-dependent monooxygenase [Halalkalibacter krulwichiae]|uniref:2-octaprenyl-3-methyl-6-methoxy-1,4-benzoquinol hydroxylase n=1 Tax=Halalkalibacter krulwichiae TaxID=199441 RepID=A0A1X9MD14_9BACI|nr:FAD-dependent monooxygenase [Halalkalibacter krulwichiae]ARK30450.1 2-octaprenyl-3-methyl-6-methoxy-1,4-benzoquinol hydroxylase [Halalkalibacter krulwichiae]
MHLDTDVCIVGGGPAGVLLGYLLAQKGISTIVLERSNGGKREFRGEHISAETEKLLKEHLLFEKIEAKGILRMNKVEYFDHGQIVRTIVPKLGEEHVGIHVPQSHLLSAVVKESKGFDNYQLFLNTAVTDLIQDEKGTYRGVKAKKNGEELTIYCSIIVGADGRFSTVRKLANISTNHLSHGYDVLWAKIPTPSNWEATTRMLLVDGHQLALFTQTGGFIQIGWNIKEGSFPELKKQPLEPLLEPLVNNFPELNKAVSRHLQSWKNFVCLKVESSRSETWVKDGLVIIGDAAHTMTPTGAIGINCAMKDAHVLAPILLDAIAKKETSAKWLKRFERVRRAEIEIQQSKQIENELSFIKQFAQTSGF